MLSISHIDQYSNIKIITIKQLSAFIKRVKKNGKTVGLCHGGFDLLHPGHVKHFASARKLCDVLVVSVTSDEFVEKRKGVGRPVFTHTLRAYMIANLAMVDRVVVSPWEKGVEIINALKPSFYIKGPDFIGKATPGIIAEREAIEKVGGEMKYTDDPPSSTSEIIEYIQKEIDLRKILVIVDRDGTILTNNDFPGKDPDWKNEITFHKPVVAILSFLKTKYRSSFMMVSNQGGVARGLFPKSRVDEINQIVANSLALQGVKFLSMEYCCDVDRAFASHNPKIKWVEEYVKEKTDRKPAITMVLNGLKKSGKTLSDYDVVLVIGDSEDDKLLARNLQAIFLDVREQSYELLKSSVEKMLTRHK